VIQSGFDHIAFPEADAAARQLDIVLAQAPSGFADVFARALAECAEPQRTLTAMVRFLEHCPDPGVILDGIASSLFRARLLCTILDQSNFLSDIICRNPAFIPWLWEGAELKRARSREEMLADVMKPEDTEASFEDCCRALRLFRQREILRIAVRAIVVHAPVVSVTEDLSNLADATLEAAILSADATLRDRFGIPMIEAPSARDSARENGNRATFVVLAMGKLGGRELNFSSDIDLLFLFSGNGKTTGGDAPAITNAEYFCKLGERVIKAISEQTADGFIFRVDMRLRPHGRTGALAVSLEHALDYYTNFGRAWERQALIKARPCAGDLDLGARFIQEMRPFVFPRYFDDRTLEDIRETKEQTEAMIAQRGETEREVKLGRGGIRDIEFTVQMIQLLNGGRWEDLRTTNTLEAIDALDRRHYLRPLEASTLASHYVFLRQVEHRLQIEDGRQCHALPEDPRKLDGFARRMGYANGEAFMHVYRDRAQETRQILDQFLAAKGSGHLWVGDLLNPHSEGRAGLDKLGELGFKEPAKARDELLLLSNGSRQNPFTLHVRQQFAEITPFLLNALAHTAYPDNALLRLGQILGKLSARATLYELLKLNPVLSHFLVTLVTNSEYLCSILIRDPGLLDTVSSVKALDVISTRESLETDLRAFHHAFDKEAAPYRLRDGEMLRIAMRDLVRGIPLAAVGDELTQLAEVLLVDALEQARDRTEARFGLPGVPFAILGLGKLGGWEMGYGSDLDLIFVYEGGRRLDNAMSPVEYFTNVAAHTLNRLKEPTRYGILYDVDARLRPDGQKGVLAVSHERLRQYYLEEAQPWERFALMKARAVAGDPDFAARIESQAKEVAFTVPFDRAALEHNESLRLKAARLASPLDLKKAKGGLNEIEYATRYWQLNFATEYPELRRGDVFGALDIMLENGLVDEEPARFLRRAYGELRRILNRIRMMDGGQGVTLPETPEARAELAARLCIEEDLLEYVQARREKIHEIYKRTYAEALSKTVT
jgi:[glutamine synthetase] adenylyltransferase / [glutamine synthetase]-adenylyl-L-tyrosine phosphorylase